MRALSDTKIKASLTAAEVRELVAVYVEAYDRGWRPAIYSPTHLIDLRNKCVELLTADVSLVETAHTTALRNP